MTLHVLKYTEPEAPYGTSPLDDFLSSNERSLGEYRVTLCANMALISIESGDLRCIRQYLEETESVFLNSADEERLSREWRAQERSRREREWKTSAFGLHAIGAKKSA